MACTKIWVSRITIGNLIILIGILLKNDAKILKTLREVDPRIKADDFGICKRRIRLQ